MMDKIQNCDSCINILWSKRGKQFLFEKPKLAVRKTAVNHKIDISEKGDLVWIRFT
jgi:hypothetical protein